MTVSLDLASLEGHELLAMQRAGAMVRECATALEDGDLTIVGEIKRGHGELDELEHYPPDDVQQNNSQYFFHWHEDRGEIEVGHFHTFLRLYDDDATHMVAISMADESTPVALFCTNEWVTDEHVVKAPTLCKKLSKFRIDHANPSWPVNRWITALLTLFRPQVTYLLHHRDERLSEYAKETGRSLKKVRRDHAIEVTGMLAINIDEQIKAVDAALTKQKSKKKSA